MNPRKPLLIFDGDCHFCRSWIERWKGITGDAVDYEAAETAADRFPDIPVEAYQRSVQLVMPDGTVHAGAEAVLAVLATGPWPGEWGLDFYRATPWFAGAAEGVYRFVARHRMAFSWGTRLLWGQDVRRPSFAISARVFLHLLGIIYLIAFLSYGVQLEGLIGDHGITPASQYFQTVHERLGADAYWQLPSLCWLGSSSVALKAWCAAGIVVAALLACGIAPAACLIFLWADYLSLVGAGQVFYGFQWDALLLEAGFLSIFLAPWTWRLRTMRPPWAAHVLLVWLLFRLMFASGVVKLSSGDSAWWDGTALDFHYFTQPLPTVAAWFAQQTPEWSKWLSVKILFCIELGLPFLLFCPRRLRLFGAAGLAFLQVLIALTGNYGFFNLLTLALCLLALDDGVWPGKWQVQEARGYLNRIALAIVAAAFFALSLVPLLSAFRTPMPGLTPLAMLYDQVTPFRSLNSYGLFAVMTKERREITVQHSEDGVTWEDYAFPHKPGDLRRAPLWQAPYMPRLDWQMWFAALGEEQDSPWFTNFMVRLLEGAKPVEALLAGPPLSKPPRYVRAVSAKYTFTTPGERKATGAWWQAGVKEEFFPKASLRGH